MRLLHVAQGTNLEDLTRVTGLNETVLSELLPQFRLKDGVVSSPFDLAIPTVYRDTAGQVAKRAEKPTSDQKLIGVFGTANQYPSSIDGARETAKKFKKEADSFAETWERLGLDAQRVFKEPDFPETRQFEKAERIFAGLKEGAHVSLELVSRSREQIDNLPEQVKTLKREARRSADRGPLVVASALERFFNALPRLLKISSSFGRGDRSRRVSGIGLPTNGTQSRSEKYWETFPRLVKVATNPKAQSEKQDTAWTQLEDLFRQLETFAREIHEADALYGEKVGSTIQELEQQSNMWRAGTSDKAKAVLDQPIYDRNVDEAESLFEAIRVALDEAIVVKEKAEQVLADLDAAGRGGEHLRRRLIEQIAATTRRTLYVGLYDVYQALPRMFRVNSALDEETRLEMAKAATDLDQAPESRKEALQQFRAIYEAMRSEARAIEAAEKTLGDQVASMEQSIDDITTTWQEQAVLPAERASKGDRNRDIPRAKALWNAAKKVLSETPTIKEMAAPLLDDLASTDGAERLYNALKEKVDSSSFWSGVAAISEVVEVLPKLLDLTFYDHLYEGDRNRLARSAADYSASQESRGAALAKLDQYVNRLFEGAKNVDRAEATFRSEVRAFAQRMEAISVGWKRDILEPAKKAAAKNTPKGDLAQSKELWLGVKDAVAFGDIALDEARALLDSLESFGEGSAQLAIDVKNAVHDVLGEPRTLIRELFKLLPRMLDVDPSIGPGEWNRSTWAQDAVNRDRPEETRRMALESLDEAFQTLTDFATKLNNLKAELGEQVTSIEKELEQVGRALGQFGWTVRDTNSEAGVIKSWRHLTELLDPMTKLEASRKSLLAQLEKAGPEAGRLRFTLQEGLIPAAARALSVFCEHLPMVFGRKVGLIQFAQIQQLAREVKGDESRFPELRIEAQKLMDQITKS